jgi:hypothetical protein
MKPNKKILHIGINDFIKAIKIADRELDQENATGFKSVDKIFSNKKKYKRNKQIKIEE